MANIYIVRGIIRAVKTLNTTKPTNKSVFIVLNRLCDYKPMQPSCPVPCTLYSAADRAGACPPAGVEAITKSSHKCRKEAQVGGTAN
jgi:hypothetical protein